MINSFGKIIKELTNAINLIEKELEELLPKKAQQLTVFTGISTLTAAIIYAEKKARA